MADCMMFPNDWHEFIKDYSFVDTEHIYTNGSELIQVLRVNQLIEHLLKEQEIKTGHWVYREPKCESAKANGGSRKSDCSICGGWGQKSFEFCPHCGAKMEGR